MSKQCCAALALIALAGCAEEPSAGQMQRLQTQIQELNQQVRQYRAEVQRANEKIVAMLQSQGRQSDLPAAQQPPVAPHAGHAGHGPALPAGSAVAEALHKAHEAMDQQMMGVVMTGDADRDFLIMMIPHHQGAIDMARILIENGKNPEIRKFAADIIAHQQAEIDMMNRWLRAPQ